MSVFNSVLTICLTQYTVFIFFSRVRSLNISPTPSLAEDLQQTNNVSVNAFSLPGQSPRVIRAILPRDETCEDDDADEIGN